MLCKGLQRVTAEHQTRVTTGKVTELVAAQYHRIEYNSILSETSMLDPRFKKLAFNDNRVADEALQRISAAAARYSEPAPLPGGQEGEEATEDEQEEPQASAVWRFFEERATGDTTKGIPQQMQYWM